MSGLVRRRFDEGGVWRTLHKARQGKALGIMPGQSHVVTAKDIDILNRSHRRMMLLLANFLVTLLVIGIAMDVVGR